MPPHPPLAMQQEQQAPAVGDAGAAAVGDAGAAVVGDAGAAAVGDAGASAVHDAETPAVSGAEASAVGDAEAPVVAGTLPEDSSAVNDQARVTEVSLTPHRSSSSKEQLGEEETRSPSRSPDADPDLKRGAETSAVGDESSSQRNKKKKKGKTTGSRRHKEACEGKEKWLPREGAVAGR